MYLYKKRFDILPYREWQRGTMMVPGKKLPTDEQNKKTSSSPLGNSPFPNHLGHMPHVNRGPIKGAILGLISLQSLQSHFLTVPFIYKLNYLQLLYQLFM